MRISYLLLSTGITSNMQFLDIASHLKILLSERRQFRIHLIWLPLDGDSVVFSLYDFSKKIYGNPHLTVGDNDVGGGGSDGITNVTRFIM